MASQPGVTTQAASSTERGPIPRGVVRACVFDAYGTLFDVAAAAARERPALGDKAAPLAQLWRQKQLEYTWLRSLMGAFTDFWRITGDGLDYAMEALGLDDAALRERLMQLYLRLDAYPEVPAVLDRLGAAGLPCAILSNGERRMLDTAVANAGLTDHLDAVLSVDDIGINKPDARVYQMAVDALGVTAPQICFLSSNAWDVAGAAHFGFTTVWVNRFAQPRERLPGTPAAMIPDLAALPAVLGLEG